jgi:hypothetical protein
MRRDSTEFECVLAVGVALFVAFALSLLPRHWQLPAGVLLAWGIFAASIGPRLRERRR